MASVYTQQSNNIQKTWLLMFAFVGIVSGLCYGFAYTTGNYAFAIIGLAVSIGQCFFSYWFGDKLALMSNGASLVEREEAPKIYDLVENLSRVAGIPMPKIHISPDPSPNAFACGRDPEHASICINQGLLNILNKNELEGVIAHELSHIKNRDILIMTTTMVLSSVIAFIADVGFRMMVFGGGNSNSDGDGDSNSPIVFVLYMIALLLAPILSTLITLAVSREREFLADATAVTLTRYPKGLSDALLKLHNDPTPTEHYSTATNHFYISEPKQSFGEKAQNWFSTHPSVEERVEALSKMG
jgi:heat shock protein HtpX